MHKLDEACKQPDNVHQSVTEERNYMILKILHIKFTFFALHIDVSFFVLTQGLSKDVVVI